MDILSPELLWIEGRCYRINDVINDEVIKPHYQRGYVEHDNWNDEEYEDEIIIETTDDSKFKTSFHVPNIFYGQIIGLKGSTRSRLEAETKCQILIPRPGQEGPMVITGPSAEAVSTCKRRIDMMILGIRNKQPFTHFLSIPFTSPEIIKGFEQFKTEVLASNKDSNFDESLFQSEKKLHLTIGTLCLADDEDRTRAADLLRECQDSIPAVLQHVPLSMHLSGVEIMNDDPTKVDVLYAKIEEEPTEGVLQTMADEVVSLFVKKGLMQNKHQKEVKLHVTLINSLYRANTPELELPAERETFDATNILRDFADFKFGSQKLEEIHLSARYTTANDGYFQSTATIDCSQDVIRRRTIQL